MECSYKLGAPNVFAMLPVEELVFLGMILSVLWRLWL